MKNVTISMDEKLVRKAKIKAAQNGESLSKYVARLVERELGDERAVLEAAITSFLEGPGFPGIAAGWSGRGALYAEREEALLHRHMHSDLRDGRKREDQAPEGG